MIHLIAICGFYWSTYGKVISMHYLNMFNHPFSIGKSSQAVTRLDGTNKSILINVINSRSLEISSVIEMNPQNVTLV